jgi:hypothetical protein
MACGSKDGGGLEMKVKLEVGECLYVSLAGHKGRVEIRHAGYDDITVKDRVKYKVRPQPSDAKGEYYCAWCDAYSTDNRCHICGQKAEIAK